MTAREKLLLALLALSLLACAHGPLRPQAPEPDLSYTIMGAVGFAPATVRVTVRSTEPVCDSLQIEWSDGSRHFRTDYCGSLAKVWSAEHTYRDVGEFTPVVFVAGKHAACKWGCLVVVNESVPTGGR